MSNDGNNGTPIAPTHAAPPAGHALPLIGPHVPILPVPTSITTSDVRFNGQSMVAMQVATPSGVQIFVFDPEMARKVAEGLSNSAAAADGGIVIAHHVPPIRPR